MQYQATENAAESPIYQAFGTFNGLDPFCKCSIEYYIKWCTPRGKIVFSTTWLITYMLYRQSGIGNAVIIIYYALCTIEVIILKRLYPY